MSSAMEYKSHQNFDFSLDYNILDERESFSPKVKVIYFSPTGTTKKIIKNVIKGIESKQVEYVDLTKDNILYNDGDIAFIDFDDAKYGESVIDISILIALFFVSSKIGVDLDGIRYFIDSYYGDDVVLKNEESCFIKQCALKWIDYTLENNEFESSLIENFELKKKLIKEYL